MRRSSLFKAGNLPIYKIISFLAILLLAGIADDSNDPRKQYEVFLSSHFKNRPDYSDNQKENQITVDHPEYAAFQDYIMTVDPATGTVPSYRLKDAAQKTREIKRKSLTTGNFFQWQEVAANVGEEPEP